MRRFLVLALVVMAAGCGKGKKIDYSVPGLTKALKDKDPDVRYIAAHNLGKYGAEAREAVPALIEALKDEDPYVRMGVAYALAGIGPDATEAIPALAEAFKDDDKRVREAAAYAVKQIQDPKPKPEGVRSTKHKRKSKEPKG